MNNILIDNSFVYGRKLKYINSLHDWRIRSYCWILTTCGMRNWLDGLIQGIVVNVAMSQCDKWCLHWDWNRWCLHQWHCQWDRAQPQQVCRWWHQAECCSWRAWRMECHPEGPGQAWNWAHGNFLRFVKVLLLGWGNPWYQ